MKSLGGYRPYEVMYIDGMNLLSRSYYGMPELAYHGHKTGMLYGLSRLVLDWRHKNPGIDFVFLWEGANSWRKAQYPIYKAQRNESKTPSETTEFFDSVERVKKCIPAMGIRQAWADTYEADDLVATLAPLEKRKSLYSSGDWDWWELSPYGNILYQHSELLTKHDMDFRFLRKFNADPVPPDKLWLFKVLTGDSSDNVSGIPRFPKKLASRLCNSGVTEHNIIQLLYKLGKGEWADKVKMNMWLVERNIALLRSSFISEEKIVYVEPDYSEERFGDILLDNGMEALYDRLKEGR